MFLEFHFKICCFVISFSFQKIGGFADEIVKSIFLLVSNAFDKASNFFDLIIKDLTIIIQSSLLKLFSFNIFIVFFLLPARQLSISTDMLWFSFKLISFAIFSLLIFFPFLQKYSIFLSSLISVSLSPLHLFTIKFIFKGEIEIFLTPKKLYANLDKV